jgi:hypothetical protein
MEYDVPLMVARGYSSLSFLNDAAEAIKSRGKPAFIYHFGDFDGSGVDAAMKIEETLKEMCPMIDISFERVGVTLEQIEEMNLPTRNPKETDPRGKNWPHDFCCELDAIEPDDLRELVRNCIEQHIDQDQLDFVRQQEQREKGILEIFAQQQRS